MFSVTVRRGDGLHPGEDIVEPLITTLPVALERGRNELDDRAHALQEVDLVVHFRPGLRLGQVIEVQESLFGVSWFGKIVGLSHAFSENQQAPLTTIRLKRPSDFFV
jgi:hypothetical protein